VFARVGSAASLLAVGAALGVGCGSVPDIRFDDDLVDASSDGPAPGCTPSGRETCDDGIDNDCNGKTDCADPACDAGFTCAPAPPADWRVVAYAEGRAAACPGGYGAPQDLRAVAGELAASCTCTCTAATACTAGPIALSHGGDGACSGGASENLAPTNACAKLRGNGFNVSGGLRTTLPGPGTCTPAPPSTGAPVKDARACAPPARVGGGCGAGQVCVPRPTSGYQACVAKPGGSACPTGFATVVHAGANATDTRACGACTCTTSPCTAQVALYAANNCPGAGEAIAASTCASVAASFNARYYKATVAGGCGVASQPTATGNVALTDEQTICCP